MEELAACKPELLNPRGFNKQLDSSASARSELLQIARIGKAEEEKTK